MIIKLAICLVLGALLWLDRVYVFLVMLSRPIVMAPLVGFAVGSPEMGLTVGAALELLWLNTPPVGSFLPPDESFCAAVCLPLALYAATLIEPQAAAGLALVLGLPTALAGRRIDIYIRQRNNAIGYAGQEPVRLGVRLALALARAFGVCLLALTGCLLGLMGVVRFAAGHLAPLVVQALGYMPLAAVVIGLAAVTTRDRRRSVEAGFFALGLVLGFILILKG